METVKRIRFEDTGKVDRGGKPVKERKTKTIEAFGVAPVVTGDVQGSDGVVSKTGVTLYFRAPNVPEIYAEDVFEVRGVEYETDGPDALWVHPDEVTRGCVVTLKRSEGIDGAS